MKSLFDRFHRHDSTFLFEDITTCLTTHLRSTFGPDFGMEMDTWDAFTTGFGNPYMQPPTHGAIEVLMRDGTAFLLPYQQAIAICPRLERVVTPGTRGRIDVGRIANEFMHICQATPGSRASSPQKVYRSLRELFYALRDSAGNPEVLCNILIHEIFGKELSSNGIMATVDGLEACRRMFVVYSLFARRTESTIISSALAAVLTYHKHRIMLEEHPAFIPLWGSAYMNIHPYLSPREAKECLRALAPRYDEMQGLLRYGNLDPRDGILVHLLDEVLGHRIGHRCLDDGWNRGRKPRRVPPFYYSGLRPHTMPPLPRLQRPWPPMNTLPWSTPPLALPMPMALCPAPYKPDPAEVVEFAGTLANNQVDLQEQVTDIKDDMQFMKDDMHIMGEELYDIGDNVRELNALLQHVIV